MSQRTRARLLNHDGTFNVRRNERGPLHPFNAYHTLLSLSIPRLVASLCGGYAVANAFFAYGAAMLGAALQTRTRGA